MTTKFVRKYIAGQWIELLIVLITTVLSVLLLATVTIATGFTSDETTSSIFGILLLIGLAMASYLRVVAQAEIDKENKKRSQKLRSRYIWFLPIIITAAILPWLLQGVLADRETSVVLSILLWLIISYAALLLGILVAVFILAPLELLARGIIKLIHGEAAGVYYVAIGLYGAIFIGFCVAGAYSLDDLPPAWLAWGPIVFALFGIPSAYTVDNEGLLWLARVLGLLLVVGMFIITLAGREPKADKAQ